MSLVKPQPKKKKKNSEPVPPCTGQESKLVSSNLSLVQSAQIHILPTLFTSFDSYSIVSNMKMQVSMTMIIHCENFSN